MSDAIPELEKPATTRKTLSPYRQDHQRGLRDGTTQIAVLKEKWPAIFNDPKNVRPLSSSVLPQITAEMGWRAAYARGVLAAWKNRNAYCRAVLRYSRRINLDGSFSDEMVEDQARKQAQAQLERIAARKAREEAKKQAAAHALDPATVEPAGSPPPDQEPR